MGNARPREWSLLNSSIRWFLNSFQSGNIMPRSDLGLQNGNQKRQPEAAIETAI